MMPSMPEMRPSPRDGYAKPKVFGTDLLVLAPVSWANEVMHLVKMSEIHK